MTASSAFNELNERRNGVVSPNRFKAAELMAFVQDDAAWEMTVSYRG